MSHTLSWDDLRILLAVYRDKSFLAAGKSLGVATSTVARRIDALEKSLGRPIIHRMNNGARLDPDVLTLVALSESLELGLDAVRRDTRGAHVAGVVRVSVSEGIVRPTTQSLARLRIKHPALALELISESRIANLGRYEADIGIRGIRSSAPNLIEKPMGRVRIGLFAARDYVERRLPGARLRRESAPQQDWVGFDRALERMPQERWLRDYGAERFVFRSNSSTAIEQAVASGIGIGLLGEAQAAALSGVVRLDADDAPPSSSIYLAYRRAEKKTPRIHAVVRELELEIRRQLGS